MWRRSLVISPCVPPPQGVAPSSNLDPKPVPLPGNLGLQGESVSAESDSEESESEEEVSSQPLTAHPRPDRCL